LILDRNLEGRPRRTGFWSPIKGNISGSWRPERFEAEKAVAVS